MSEGSISTENSSPNTTEIDTSVEPHAETDLDNKEASEIKKSVDLLIVLGQGPVKPVLREQDLDDDMKTQWESFKSDPLHNLEPEFRVVKVDDSLDEEAQQKELLMLQNQGRLALNRWGRENALAAGFALVSGYTDRLLLSGGKTMPSWAKEEFGPDRIADWPSEAELMADVIERRFGKLYSEIYGKSIRSAIATEDSSTNTLENFANTINSELGQDILDGVIKAGVLSANQHVPRSEDIALLFAPRDSMEKGTLAQDVLKARIADKNFKTYDKILNWMTDPNNPDLRARILNEKRWSSGLNTPELLTYWLGYIGIAENPQVLTSTIERLSSKPEWKSQAQAAFSSVGLDFDSISQSDPMSMDKDSFKEIADKLKILTTNEHRKMPEIEPLPAQFSVLRHIPTVWNRENRIQGNTDVDIDPNAIKPWLETTDLTSLTKPDVIITSALKRTRQTAQVIVGKMNWQGIEVVPFPELNERAWGVFQGKTKQEILPQLASMFPDIKDTEELLKKIDSPGFKVEGAETPEEVAERSEKALSDINKRFPGKNVLLISHAGTMLFLGLDSSRINNFTLDQLSNIQEDTKETQY